MTEKTFALEYSNGLGQSRWQPLLPNGRGLYHYLDFNMWSNPSLTYHASPVLYRSKRRAEAVARREYRRHLARKFEPIVKDAGNGQVDR